MTSRPDDGSAVLARDAFAATLVRRPGGRLVRSGRFLAAFAAELAWGLLPAPSLSDVLVTRRRDGVERVRVSAGDANVPGEMLAVVQRQLEELDPAAFLAEWGESEPA
ncbi:hypothetical protein SAMN05661080_03062 [Modestobacter sp. DSM 44400]|uniref:hypothetical protein n=1 Tax=Modestobacter sp. DSM 44400 TaxID=1550230 RepID=UPI00089D5617|nr:hypothetical protein [Modestobacter sp. DSM 44400]SDY32085.1 hypothetical protein SAMN05661080_03062 [Modestobacter sp. DSM 44400]